MVRFVVIAAVIAAFSVLGVAVYVALQRPPYGRHGTIGQRLPLPSPSPCPIVSRHPVDRQGNITFGFLVALHSNYTGSGHTLFENKTLAEFARLVIALRETHNIPIAVVVDDLVEAWLEGTEMDGIPSASCLFGFNIQQSVDVVINAQRHPETAGMWEWGQEYVATHHAHDSAASLILRTVAMRVSPFVQTIYLDHDVMICGPLYHLFAILDRFDAAVVPDPLRHAVPAGLFKASESVTLVNLSLFAYNVRLQSVKCLLDQTFNAMIARLVDSSPSRHFATHHEAFMDALWTCKDANIWALREEWFCRNRTTCSSAATTVGDLKCRTIQADGLFELPEFRVKNWADL